MLRTILIILLFTVNALVFGQTTTKTEILSEQETLELFSEGLNKQLDFMYPIRRVYKCIDKYENYYIVLKESIDTIISNDTLHQNVEAFMLTQGKKRLGVHWSMKDSTNKQVNNDNIETSIWFWTKYCEFTDIDNDSLIDPIFIYGTAGINGTSDGRIKILICYKGQNAAILHQNGILDFERHTNVDDKFYSLPSKVQDHVKLIMKKMADDNNAIFPYGWQEAITKKKLYFDENQ